MSLLLQYMLPFIIVSGTLLFLIIYYRNLRTINNANESLENNSEKPLHTSAEKDNFEEIYQQLTKKYSLTNINNKKTYNKNKQLLVLINQAYNKKDIEKLKSFL